LQYHRNVSAATAKAAATRLKHVANGRFPFSALFYAFIDAPNDSLISNHIRP
jgi:hypothetical protein